MERPTIFLVRGEYISMFVSQDERNVQACAEKYPNIIYFFAHMMLESI